MPSKQFREVYHAMNEEERKQLEQERDYILDGRQFESDHAMIAALKKCLEELAEFLYALSAALESERATHNVVVVALKNRIGELETENAEMRGTEN